MLLVMAMDVDMDMAMAMAMDKDAAGATYHYNRILKLAPVPTDGIDCFGGTVVLIVDLLRSHQASFRTRCSRRKYTVSRISVPTV
jgi:hypothetical protein